MLTQEALHALAVHRCAGLAASERGNHSGPIGWVLVGHADDLPIDLKQRPAFAFRLALWLLVDRLAAHLSDPGDDRYGADLRD